MTRDTAERAKELARVYVLNWVPGDGIEAWKALTTLLTSVQAEARLEEAKWWNSLQEHQRHHSLVSLTCSADNIPTIEACARLGCKMCARIAALAQALQPEEKEGEVK